MQARNRNRDSNTERQTEAVRDGKETDRVRETEIKKNRKTL